MKNYGGFHQAPGSLACKRRQSLKTWQAILRTPTLILHSICQKFPPPYTYERPLQLQTSHFLISIHRWSIVMLCNKRNQSLPCYQSIHQCQKIVEKNCVFNHGDQAQRPSVRSLLLHKPLWFSSSSPAPPVNYFLTTHFLVNASYAPYDGSYWAKASKQWTRRSIVGTPKQ